MQSWRFLPIWDFSHGLSHNPCSSWTFPVSLLWIWGGFVSLGVKSIHPPDQCDFLVFIGEPVRNPSGECQVNAQSAADPLVCPPGSLGCLYRSGHCLLCSCLLPGWEQLRGNQSARSSWCRAQRSRWREGCWRGEGSRSCYSNWVHWHQLETCLKMQDLRSLQWPMGSETHLSNIPKWSVCTT